jgi:Mlc titration factor MtfA (ptsG expression regulator)
MNDLIPLAVFILINGAIVAMIVMYKIRVSNITITEAQAYYLKHNLPVYDTLCTTDKERFNHRVGLFLRYHRFSGREGLIITDEIRLTIAGAGIHLTFGLKDFMFTAFPEIYVYPSVYYSPFSKTTNKGETNPRGIIAFSWPHYLDGFRTTEDRINLGYHEFAHALIIQRSGMSINNTGYDLGYQIFSAALANNRLAQKARELDFLREYAFRNKMEFFAVSAEYFLEDPQGLYAKFPALYRIMSRVLCMDPMTNRLHIDFKYTEDFPEEVAARIMDGLTS